MDPDPSDEPESVPPPPPTIAIPVRERVPAGSLEDLKGMDEIQTQIKATVIVPFANASKAALLQLEVSRGIMLTGLPGTGKTALADAIVTEIRKTREVKYYRSTGASLLCSEGDPTENLRQLFKTAKDNAPSVILLDEVDGFGQSRSWQKSSILTILLTEIGNLVPGEVLLIATTNRLDLCDGALIKEGRFNNMFYLPMPSSEAREEIVQHYFGQKEIISNAEIMAEIMQRTENCSGSELKYLVEHIYKKAVDRVFPNGSWKDLEQDAIQAGLGAVQEIDMELDVKPALTELEDTTWKSMYMDAGWFMGSSLGGSRPPRGSGAGDNCTIV